MAAQARRMNAEVWRFERVFRNNGNARRNLGVRVAPESTHVKLVSGRPPADYRVGRQLMSFPPIELSLNGQVKEALADRGEGPPNSWTPRMNLALPLNVSEAGIIRNCLSQIRQNAGSEAIQAYLAKKGEIARLRKRFPSYPVKLEFVLQYQPGVNLYFPDTLKFEELNGE